MADPLTPDWWLDRLFKSLMDRRPAIDDADRWYDGKHPAPWNWQKANELVRYLLDATQTNFLALLVDAAHERMHVDGFKVDGHIDSDIWPIWQGNNFDAALEQVLLESMALGEASILVDPTKNAFGFPTITPEHPAQTIVEYQPGSRQVRAAGLKVWLDDLGDDLTLQAMLYLPDRVYAFEAEVPRNATGVNATLVKPTWELSETGSGPNELKEVPLVDLQCRPRMMKPGSPEFQKVIPIQRRVNKTVLDRLVNQEFGAFKQKWATGLPMVFDPVSGQPTEPFKSAVDRMLQSENPETKFGAFEVEDLKQLLEAVSDDVQHMAAIVPTPPHYLLGAMVNLSAEALKAAEASLVSRIRRHERSYEEPIETVARLGLKAAGLSVPNVSAMTTVWRNPEFRTEGELVAALVQMGSIGVPQEALWERWGATPQEIEQWKSMQTDAATRGDLAGLFGPPQPTPMPGMPGAAG